MLESLPFILFLSTVLGFLSGIGIGGGSLLILWLTLVLNMPQPEARGINLLFFIPSALVACIFRWRQNTLDVRNIIPAIVSGCIAAGFFSWVSMCLDTQILQKMFGAILIITGLRELLYKPKRGG